MNGPESKHCVVPPHVVPHVVPPWAGSDCGASSRLGRVDGSRRHHAPTPDASPSIRSRADVGGAAGFGRLRPPLAGARGVLLAALLVACGGSKKGAEDASRLYEPKSTTPWKDKTREQRMDWMGIAVLPKMRRLFIEQDSEKYEDFACQTCHGKDMELVDFEMPNHLFALAANDTLGQAKEYDEKTTDFMLGAVVPEMAKLLDQEAFTLESQAGFGCAGCHPTTQ
jgi:hypothetical protein